MAWLPSCSFRFWRRKRALSAVPQPTNTLPVEEQTRPHTSSAAVATSTGADTTPPTTTTATTTHRRLGRLSLPEALTSALRARSRSCAASRPSSQRQQRQQRDPEKQNITKKTDTANKNDRPPRLDLDIKATKLKQLLDDEKKKQKAGAKDATTDEDFTDEEVTDDNSDLRHGNKKRVDSGEWPDTPATTVTSSSQEEKSQLVEAVLANGKTNKDAKLKDEAVADDDVEEAKRKAKMEEARRKAEQAEQERLDFFQMM